jgi:hypothetical protein
LQERMPFQKLCHVHKPIMKVGKISKPRMKVRKIRSARNSTWLILQISIFTITQRSLS